MKKAVYIFTAIIIGSIFNYGHQYTFLIRYNLMIMLFLAFINIRFDAHLFEKRHYKVLVINILFPVILFSLLRPFYPNLAELAFLLTIIPTAAAGPVIAEIMKTNVVLVTGSVILTTPIVALSLPFLLSHLVGIDNHISILGLAFPILSLVFIPLLLSQGLLHFLPNWSQKIKKLHDINLYLFLINIFIACGNASYYVQENLDTIGNQLFWIAGATAILCVLNFNIGRLVSGKKEVLAFELAMGRKNTMIGLWLALEYFSPIIALGPIFYIIAHNVYNSFQLWRLGKD